MKKLLLLLVVVAMVAALVTGCGGGKSAGLVMNWGSEPPDLDPQTTTDQVSFWILNATLEGLTRQSPQGEPEPGLAEKWDISDDGLTYTFHLRNAKWSDGTAVTAQDFEYAWKRAIDPNTASEYAYQMYHIKNAMEVNTGVDADGNETTLTLDDVGVKALDDKTLQVELVRPTVFFLSLTSFITYLPAQKAAVDQWGDEYGTDADKMVYSGPFVVSEWQHEQELTLAKNEDYWDAKTVKLPSVTGYMITEQNTEVQMYDTDEMDILFVGPDFLEQYKDNPEYEQQPQATTWYLQFNNQDKYFSNYKIRKAFSMATDAQTYVNEIRQGLGQVATEFTPPTMAGTSDSANFAEDVQKAVENGMAAMPQYDPAEAATLLDEGLAEVGATKEDLQADCTIVGGDSDTWTTIMQFLQGQWEQNLGVRLEIEQMTFAERLERYNQGTFAITYAGWGGDYNDPLTFMDMWVTGGGNNDSYWSSEEYDALIDTAINGQGDDRINAMVQAEGILAAELPIYPLYWPVRSVAQKSRVHDVAWMPVGSDIEFKWAYVDEQ